MSTTEPIQRLRKQMVCRRPTDADLRARVPIVITERDKELLADVHKHGFLTAELIELAHFPDDAQRRRSRSSCCYDRLKALWLWTYLDRVELPIARVLGGRRPFLYALGRRGVPLVQAQLSPDGPPVQPRRLDRLHDLFIEHDLRAAALWASLTAVVRTSRLQQLDWTPERELRGRKLRVKDPTSGRWLPFLPDALFELWYPDGSTQAVIVEIDMGTIEHRRFRQKIRATERFIAEGLLGQHFDIGRVEVWVLAPSPARIEHLRRTAWPEVPEDRREVYLFATFDALTPEGVAQQPWLYLDGKPGPALYPDAFETPTKQGGTTT